MSPSIKHQPSPCIILVFLSICITTSTASLQLSFEEGDTNAPENMDETAVGYDTTTNTTLLFGGDGVPKQFIKFKDHSFFDGMANHLSSEIYCVGQGYTQLNNKLWVIPYTAYTGDTIISIDLTTYNPLANNTITIPTYDVAYGACLTSIDHYLIVVGGGSWSQDVALTLTQIYDINTNQWLSNVPSLNTPRMSVSCIIVNHLLYAIGGSEGAVFYLGELDTIETLDVSDMSSIQAQQWQYLNSTLRTARGGTRTVSHGSDIVVIGGDDIAGDRVADINIIDTNNGQIYIGGQLAFGTSYAASIIVDNILYVFGGFTNTGGSERRYQYAVMPKTSPTTYPPSNPSRNPTNVPSQYPTNDPITFIPTLDPSRNPTNIPSQYPTLTPSIHPVNTTFNSSLYAMTTSMKTTVSSNIDSTNQPSNGDEMDPENESIDWVLVVLVIVVSLLGVIVMIAVVCFVMKCHKASRDTPILAKHSGLGSNGMGQAPAIHKVNDGHVNEDNVNVTHGNGTLDRKGIDKDHVIAGGNTFGEGVCEVLDVQRPASLVNKETMGVFHAADDEIIVGDEETCGGVTGHQ
eukprot:655066_1